MNHHHQSQNVNLKLELKLKLEPRSEQKADPDFVPNRVAEPLQVLVKKTP